MSGADLVPTSVGATVAVAASNRDASSRPSGTLYARQLKRLCDLALAVVLLPFVAPVIGLLWLATRLDGGPGFYGHVRMGQGGVPFRCWKVRTMVPDAEDRLKRHLASDPRAAEEWRTNFKLCADPRVTRVGAFLRKTSLDELPQIWNVLVGDMSFVGPRPVVEEELRLYGHFVGAYLAVRPGITGPWQVSGRNDLTYPERVRLDRDYVARISLLRDLGIILWTVVAVLRRTGR